MICVYSLFLFFVCVVIIEYWCYILWKLAKSVYSPEEFQGARIYEVSFLYHGSKIVLRLGRIGFWKFCEPCIRQWRIRNTILGWGNLQILKIVEIFLAHEPKTFLNFLMGKIHQFFNWLNFFYALTSRNSVENAKFCILPFEGISSWIRHWHRMKETISNVFIFCENSARNNLRKLGFFSKIQAYKTMRQKIATNLIKIDF